MNQNFPSNLAYNFWKNNDAVADGSDTVAENILSFITESGADELEAINPSNLAHLSGEPNLVYYMNENKDYLKQIWSEKPTPLEYAFAIVYLQLYADDFTQLDQYFEKFTEYLKFLLGKDGEKFNLSQEFTLRISTQKKVGKEWIVEDARGETASLIDFLFNKMPPPVAIKAFKFFKKNEKAEKIFKNLCKTKVFSKKILPSLLAYGEADIAEEFWGKGDTPSFEEFFGGKKSETIIRLFLDFLGMAVNTKQHSPKVYAYILSQILPSIKKGIPKSIKFLMKKGHITNQDIQEISDKIPDLMNEITAAPDDNLSPEAKTFICSELEQFKKTIDPLAMQLSKLSKNLANLKEKLKKLSEQLKALKEKL
jgi:hypothetical protein